MLIDAYQRRVTYLRLSVTDRCNLRCQYCMPPEGLSWMPTPELMQDDEIVRLVREVFLPLGVSKLRLTGGEPTVRAGLPALIGRLAAIEGIEDLSLSTNGIMLDRLAKPCREAGLQRVNISLDSLKPERYAELTRGGQLARVLVGIEAALAAGLEAIKLNVVLVPGVNDDEILDFAALSVERPLHIRFIELMHVGDREFYDAKGFLPVAEVEARIRERYGLAPAPGQVRGNGPAAVQQIPGALGTLGFITPMSRNFCDACNRTRLTADGKIKACLMRPQELDLLGLLRAGAPAEQMQALVLESLGFKPRHHEWGAGQPIHRTMSQIGG